jgi:hypothetical protein
MADMEVHLELLLLQSHNASIPFAGLPEQT